MITELLMIALLTYQVTMPQVDNAKFTFTTHESAIVRMNTQTGAMEKCTIKDDKLECISLTSLSISPRVEK